MISQPQRSQKLLDLIFFSFRQQNTFPTPILAYQHSITAHPREMFSDSRGQSRVSKTSQHEITITLRWVQIPHVPPQTRERTVCKSAVKSAGICQRNLFRPGVCHKGYKRSQQLLEFLLCGREKREQLCLGANPIHGRTGTHAGARRTKIQKSLECDIFSDIIIKIL